MKYCDFIVALSLIISAAITTSLIAQVYQYKNASGRLVQTTQLPPGVKAYNNSGVPSKSSEDNISQFCHDKWENNFEMRIYCEKNQRKAQVTLNRYPEDILEFCQNKWDNNFEMIVDCAKKQYSAKKRLGQ